MLNSDCVRLLYFYDIVTQNMRDHPTVNEIRSRVDKVATTWAPSSGASKNYCRMLAFRVFFFTLKFTLFSLNPKRTQWLLWMFLLIWIHVTQCELNSQDEKCWTIDSFVNLNASVYVLPLPIFRPSMFLNVLPSSSVKISFCITVMTNSCL